MNVARNKGRNNVRQIDRNYAVMLAESSMNKEGYNAGKVARSKARKKQNIAKNNAGKHVRKVAKN